MTVYVSHADTNKPVRKALKESFPGVKFSVRKSGGSTYVSWTDGPTKAEGCVVASTFEGANFDSMTDYQGGNIHSMNGEEVHFMANFIFSSRHESDGLVNQSSAALDAMNNDERYKLICKAPPRVLEEDDQGVVSLTPEGLAGMLSLCLPKASPTAESVELVRSY